MAAGEAGKSISRDRHPKRMKKKKTEKKLVVRDFPAEVLLSLESVVGWLVG